MERDSIVAEIKTGRQIGIERKREREKEREGEAARERGSLYSFIVFLQQILLRATYNKI